MRLTINRLQILSLIVLAIQPVLRIIGALGDFDTVCSLIGAGAPCGSAAVSAWLFDPPAWAIALSVGLFVILWTYGERKNTDKWLSEQLKTAAQEAAAPALQKMEQANQLAAEYRVFAEKVGPLYVVLEAQIALHQLGLFEPMWTKIKEFKIPKPYRHDMGWRDNANHFMAQHEPRRDHWLSQIGLDVDTIKAELAAIEQGAQEEAVLKHVMPGEENDWPGGDAKFRWNVRVRQKEHVLKRVSEQHKVLTAKANIVQRAEGAALELQKLLHIEARKTG